MILPPIMAESLLTPSGITLSSLKGNSASEDVKHIKASHSESNRSCERIQVDGDEEPRS